MLITVKGFWKDKIMSNKSLQDARRCYQMQQDTIRCNMFQEFSIR